MTEKKRGETTPRVRTPKIKLNPSDPIFNAIPEMVKPAFVAETFEQFISRLPFMGTYADDIYRAVRAVKTTGNPSRSLPSHHYNQPAEVLALKTDDIIAWPVYGKPLKPVLVVIKSSVELRRALARCGKETILPTTTQRRGYVEAVAHLPKKGEALVIRVPAALFQALPQKLQEKVYARDLRNRLLGQFVVQWFPNDPVMLRPIAAVDRRRIVSLGTPSVPDMAFPQVVPPRPPPSGQIHGPRYLDYRQPSDWTSNPNAPEHDLMKWDLTLFDVASDFGLKTAFRIMADTAKSYGWAAVLANPHTQNGFTRWRTRKEREVVLTLTRLYPSLKKHAKRVSDVLNLSASLFGTAKKATESAKASADWVAGSK